MRARLGARGHPDSTVMSKYVALRSHKLSNTTYHVVIVPAGNSALKQGRKWVTIWKRIPTE